MEKFNPEEEIPKKEEHASLYGEEQWIHEYSTMPTHILEDKLQQFIGYLNDPKTLPHHKKAYARLIDHIHAETSYREVLGDNAHAEDFIPEDWDTPNA